MKHKVYAFEKEDCDKNQSPPPLTLKIPHCGPGGPTFHVRKGCMVLVKQLF